MEASADLLGDLSPEEGAGGAAADENLGPNQLTGLPGIDNAQQVEARILDARGSGRVGDQPIIPGRPSPFPLGQWMLTDAGSEYEITVASSLLPDGIVRLAGRSAFVIEPPVSGPVPRFRIFGGHASFYLPHLPASTQVLTPAGMLTTRGAVFTVTVAPDFQVLITCREGAVYLTGSQNAVAMPGQVVVADRLGRGRVYAMTPNEALVFAERWLTVMSEEAAPVLEASLAKRRATWEAIDPSTQPEEARFLALWFRQAEAVLGAEAVVPGVQGPLGASVVPSPWSSPLGIPGLLGETP